MKVYWLSYYKGNKRIRESSGTRDEAKAWDKLRDRQSQVATGSHVEGADQVTFEELVEGLFADYTVRKRKSLPDVKIKVTKHLLPVFKGKTVHDIKTAAVKTFVADRQKGGASNAEINR